MTSHLAVSISHWPGSCIETRIRVHAAKARFSGQLGRQQGGPLFGVHVLHVLFPVAHTESVQTSGQPAVGMEKGTFLGAHLKAQTPVYP